MKSTYEQIADILVEKMGIARTEITSDANFIKDLGVDSLDYAELVMELEQVFDIKIPDSDAEKLQTIKDTIDYVNEKTSATN